jgi:hypothetical protein
MVDQEGGGDLDGELGLSEKEEHLKKKNQEY